MAQPPTKRKVMGRIDLAQEPSSSSSGYSPRSTLSTPRSTYSSPPTSSGSSTTRKVGAGGASGGPVRARVDMSALAGMSSLSPPAHAEGTPPLRRTGSSHSTTSGVSALAPSPFARVNPSSVVAAGGAGSPSTPRHGSSSSVHLPGPPRALLEESSGTHSGNVTLRKHRARGAAHNRSMDASSSSNGSSIVPASPGSGRAPSPAHSTYAASPSSSALRAPAPLVRGHARAVTTHASPASSNATPTATFSSRPNIYGRRSPVHRSRTPSPSPPTPNGEFLHPGPSNGASSNVRRASTTLSPTASYESPSGSPSFVTSALPPLDSDSSTASIRRRSSGVVARDTSGSASPGSSVSVSVVGAPSTARRALARNGSLHAAQLTSFTQGAIAAQTGSGGVSPTTYTDAAFASSASAAAQTPGPYSPALVAPSNGGGGVANAPFASLIASGLLSPSLEVSAGQTHAEATEAAEARVHRRLLDLEITNKSLLIINDGLEKTKLRQTKELSDLRRKLREGRFSLAGATTVVRREGDAEGALEEDEDYLDAEDGEEEEGEEDPELEASHVRCKSLIDHMIVQARAAIAYEFVDETAKKGGNRVLHPVEMQEMEEERRERRRVEKEEEERKLAAGEVSLTLDTEEEGEMAASADVTLDSSQDETVSTNTAEESDGGGSTTTTDDSLSELSSSMETSSDATEVPDIPKPSPLYGDISVD